MNFWFVSQTAEPLPGIDKGQRIMRLGLLGQQLINLGHQVTWWTSEFKHSTKTHRYGAHKSVDTSSGWQFELIKGLGYRNNFSYRRVQHNRDLAKKFARFARDKPSPDLILAPLPAPEVTAAASRFGIENRIPVVVDIRDLWPQAIIELFPKILQPVGRMLLSGMEKQVRYSCRKASSIVAMSSEFVEWGAMKAARNRRDTDRVFRHAYTSTENTTQIKSKYLSEVQKKICGHFVIVFIGTHGASVDADPVIDCARRFELNQSPIAWIMVGDGPSHHQWREKAKDIKSMYWTGRVGKQGIQEALSMADVGLVPYKTTENLRLGVPNKIGEYLSAGLPLLNGLAGSVANLVEQHKVGVNYHHSSVENLEQAIYELKQNPIRKKSMQVSAERLFYEQFEAGRVYKEFAHHLEKMARCGA